MNDLLKRHRRAKKTDVDKIKEDTAMYLQANYKPQADHVIKYGEDETLETLADIWEFVAENIEREAWKSYTREDWEELERQYVERTDYTEPDLFDDILTKYERGLFTAEEAQAYAKQYRKCKYRFCENVFKPHRKNQWYVRIVIVDGVRLMPKYDSSKQERIYLRKYISLTGSILTNDYIKNGKYHKKSKQLKKYIYQIN